MNIILATDGFKLTWRCKYAGDILALGHMTINRIADLRRVAGIRQRYCDQIVAK